MRGEGETWRGGEETMGHMIISLAPSAPRLLSKAASATLTTLL